MMIHWRSQVYEMVARQSGLVTLKQFTEAGCHRRTVERMAASGEMVSVLPGVYRSASWPMGKEQVKVAACLRNPLAALAFTTAGQEWGLRRMIDSRVHVLVPHGASPSLEGLVVHRCRRIDPCDVVQREGGIRITSVARTLFDVGGVIGFRRLESAFENAIDKKLVRFEDIAEAVQRLFHLRRPGSKEIRSVINSRANWSVAVQSELELQVKRMMKYLGIPEPVAQYELCLDDGSVIRFDFAWPHLRIALEVDHSFWHSGSAESHKDKSRDRRAAMAGWQTIRLTEDDVNRCLEATLCEVKSIIDAACKSLGK